MSSMSFDMVGWDECIKKIERLGKVPKKHVTAAVKKSMNPILKAARAGAPKDSGDLRKGIILVGERNRPRAKKVYRIVFDRKYNQTFQKPDKSGKVTGYYPVSMEYGFFDKKGVHHSSSATTGWESGFIHDVFDGQKVEAVIIATMKTKLDQEIAKEGLT